MRRRGVFPLFVNHNVCDLSVEVHFSGAGYVISAWRSIFQGQGGVSHVHNRFLQLFCRLSTWGALPPQLVVHAFVLPEAEQERPEGDGGSRTALGV